MIDPKRKLSLLAALFLLPALVAAQAANPTPAPAPGQPNMVILVRHAEKAKEGGDDPALSVAGAARAQALAKGLESLKVTAIVTTQLKRTGQTAAPLAAALGLTPEVVEVKRGEPIPEHAAKVAAAVRKHAGGIVLVVGHSNTVTPIIAALGGPTLPDIPDSEYGNLFLLMPNPSGGPAQLTQSKYGAPDSGDPGTAPTGTAAPEASAAPAPPDSPDDWYEVENAKLGFDLVVPIFSPWHEGALRISADGTAEGEAQARIQNYTEDELAGGEAPGLRKNQFWIEIQIYAAQRPDESELRSDCLGEIHPLEQGSGGAWCRFDPARLDGEGSLTHTGWVAQNGRLFRASMNAGQLEPGAPERIFRSLGSL